jgi:FkbM family methyltransferase
LKGSLAARLRERRGRRQWRRYERRKAVTELVRRFAAAYPEASFVEIGANDGVQHDHLRPHVLANPWSGVMVEPVPYVFERLRRNYGELPGVSLENVAIADRDGRLPFFHLAEVREGERRDLPAWYDAIGSFSLETVRRNASAIPGGESRIVRVEVPCLTFESLCRRHGLDRLDLVAIDAEGYDAEILRQIDFERRRPRLILYEHYHLPAGQRDATREWLRSLGYEAMEEFLDTYCLDPRDDELTRAWRRLRPAVAGISAVEA